MKINTTMQKGKDYTGITITYLCHDGEGNVVFNKRSTNCRDEHGMWDCGGGGLDFGDTVIDTLPSPLHSQFPNFLQLYKDRI